MDNHALFHKELWDWLLKMAGEDDPLGNLMKTAIEEVILCFFVHDCREKK